MYASDSSEIGLAIAIIEASVVVMLLMLIIIWCRSRVKKKDRKAFETVQKTYGAIVDELLDDDAEELSIEKMAERFGVELPPREVIRERLIKDSKGKMPTDEVIDAKVLKELMENGGKKLESKRLKRMFCQMVFNRVITDSGKLCSIDNLHHILKLFNLPKFLEEELDYGNLRRKVSTMNMMNIFRLEINPWLINTLLQSRNPQVKRQAMYASVMSGSESNMDYFESDFFDRNCCMKDEIELGYTLQRCREAGMELPNLARLAQHHQHADTQCIFVRLMRSFEQKDYCRQLEPLFTGSRSKKLTAEIARTWGMLDYKQAASLISEAMPTQSDDTKIFLMEALARLRTVNAQELFADTFKKSGNTLLRLQALRCLYHIEGGVGTKFRELETNQSKGDEVFFNYFHNKITKQFVPLAKNQRYVEGQTTVYHKPQSEITIN